MSPPLHRQTRATHPSGKRIAVDAGIAPLLRALWKRGIETIASCENSDGYVWLQFAGGRDAEEFATIASWREPTFAWWKWNVSPWWTLNEPEGVCLFVSISFPVDQYETILARLR